MCYVRKNVHDIISIQNHDAKEHFFFFLMWGFSSLCQSVVVDKKAGMSYFQWGLGE